MCRQKPNRNIDQYKNMVCKGLCFMCVPEQAMSMKRVFNQAAHGRHGLHVPHYEEEDLYQKHFPIERVVLEK